MSLRLTMSELSRFQSLVKDAQNTPVIIFKSGDKDLATTAWERVHMFMQDMSIKYAYPYDQYVINAKTGDIITLKEANNHNKRNGH